MCVIKLNVLCQILFSQLVMLLYTCVVYEMKAKKLSIPNMCLLCASLLIYAII